MSTDTLPLPTLAEPPDGLSTRKLNKNEIRPETILGVEYEILIKFLKLFRDHYRKCEKATTFLETRTDIPNIASIANQRDAISHFKSALQETTSREKRQDQYAAAEEHFRRAIIEPYEIALNKKTTLLEPVLQKYRKFVLPVRDRFELLQPYPDEESLENTLLEIGQRRMSARMAKGKNIWDEEWENGVEDYVQGFEMTHELLNRLESAVYKLQTIRDEEKKQGEIAKLKQQLEERDRKIADLEKLAEG